MFKLLLNHVLGEDHYILRRNTKSCIFDQAGPGRPKSERTINRGETGCLLWRVMKNGC